MLRQKLSVVIIVTTITNLISTPVSVWAETTNINEIIQDSQEESKVNEAEVSKF